MKLLSSIGKNTLERKTVVIKGNFKADGLEYDEGGINRVGGDVSCWNNPPKQDKKGHSMESGHLLGWEMERGIP